MINVVDGDTIDVLLDGLQNRVRYILVDTPETKHSTRGVEPFGPEAYEFIKALVKGQVSTYPPDVKYVEG